MGAGLAPLVSELRAGPEYRRYGDPFEWSAVVVHEGPDRATVRCVDRPVPPSLWRELRAAFLAAGITRVEFERIRHGRTERHEVEG